MLTAVPMNIKQARAFVDQYHRHHRGVRKWKFGVGVAQDGRLCGVAIVGRPISRELDDGKTLEVNRCCTDGTQNACSFLYSRVCQAARALGYSKVITYILAEEDGRSLKASGFSRVADSNGGSWSTPSRRREDKAPTGPKVRWERSLE